MSISLFLPVRKGSQRIPNKNTKKFGDFEGGLLELKLSQLVEVELFDDLIVSTNDELCKEIAQAFGAKVIIDDRPDHLASSSTNLSDLIQYVPTITNANHIAWTHVTSPFFSAKLYVDAINEYYKALENGYDSLMSVTPFQNFLWDDSLTDIINRESSLRWPQTQDLKKYYEINSALFLASREQFMDGDRVGKNPFLYLNSKLDSLDVDWEDDFKIAEAVYEKFNR